MAAAWRIVFVDNSIIRNANMFHQDIWPHHQQSQAIQNIYASPIYVLVPDSAKAKQAVLPVELRASSNVITSTGAVVVNRRRIGKIADNYQEPIGRGEDFKGTWHGCQAAVKEIRSPWRCSTVVEARSFAKMIKREVEALSAVRYYWTARRESNDADRSPSHRETLHLLHSTQQKPGGSVMVHRDVKSANVLLQRDDEGRVVRAGLANFGLPRFHLYLNGSGLAASSMTAVSSTYRRAGLFACPSRLKVAWNITPIPSNVNLQKEREVCIFFTLEGHGDTITLNLPCGVEGKKAKEISRVIISDTTIATAVHYWSSIDPSLCNQFAIMVNYGVMLLLGRPRVYRCLLDTVAPSYFTKAPEYYTKAPNYCTIKAPEYYTTTYAAAAYFTHAPNYYFVPSYYTEAPVYYTTKAIEYYTQVPKYYTAIYAAPAYTTK
ncbi:hypothetical protein DAPPUDRAFT_235872 [Daphnia pulex]|uniref:Protein kinase domain-containing protein n=1 Tax=Daphnia pulex TaxID=6669 RepID=E9FZ98_DAPPU|nr:hypothetical protein DAPPUDRAFT_235872 [Daphnia pulex]|eukprot:EFX87018.1 hypothetical protein DAPPUDRAFT_235872 [Daphnia pulex]